MSLDASLRIDLFYGGDGGAGNTTVFGAPPSAYTLPYAALVAGDASKYALRASIEGTEFAATTPKAALPSSISLNAPGIACSPANLTAATGTGKAPLQL